MSKIETEWLVQKVVGKRKEGKIFLVAPVKVVDKLV